MDFQPINTQEEFDTRIAERLNREKAKYADYDQLKTGKAESDKKIGELQAQVSTLTGKVKAYETASAKTRIGLAAGLPYDLTTRLSGETEEEITADAAKLAKLCIPNAGSQPLYNPESSGGNNNDAALRDVLRNLRQH